MGERDEETREDRADEGLYVRVGGRQWLLPGGSPAKRWTRKFFRLLPRLPGFRWYSARVAPRWVRLERVDVPLPALPPGLAGLRVGLLTDAHHDAARPLNILARGVALLNAAEPDLILLGGDYVVSRAADFERCAAILGRLRAPLGVYAILGNHDYWPGGDLIAAKVAAAGPIMLRNRSRRLVAPGGAPFWLVGLDDAVRGRHDIDAALAGVPRDAFRLLLAHEPDVADGLHARGARADLQLSGHTHGGQVVLPRIGPLLLPRLGRRYVRGLHLAAPWPIYTSRGLGAVPPYWRLNCPPEVTVLTLTSAECGVESAEPAG